ncbi:stabilizer of axonemal microtubules 4 isoform 2-T2 [Spheniscus humboldti]
MRHLAGYRETASPSQSLASTGTFHSHPCAPDPPGRQGAAPAQPLPWRRPVRPSVPIPVLSCGPCRRARLPRGWAPSPPRRRRVPGGSADLMNFYATSYALAHGRPRFRPRLGHHTGTGYVSNNHSAVSCLLCPRNAAEGHCQDTATSTTAEHFKPFWFPDGRSPLPRHVHQPGSGVPPRVLSYLPPHRGGESPADAASPGPPQSIQGARHREPPHRSCPARCPAEDDHRHHGAVGLHQAHPKERQRPPASPAGPAREPQPHRLGVSITTTDYLPSVRSHGGETLPALPAGSERGSGFSREVPGCLGTAVSRTPSHCPSPRALPVLTRCPHPGLAHGGPPRPARLPRAAGTPRDPGQPAGTAGCWQEGGCRHDPGPVGLCTQTTSIPQEPSGFTTNHGQRVTPRPPLSPAAPARCWRGPTWMARPTGGDPAPVPQRLWHQQPPHRTGGHHQPLPGVAPPERPEVVLPHPGGPRLGSSPGFFGDPPSPWEHAEK